MPIPTSPRVLATTSGAYSAAVVENSFFRSLEKFEQEVPQTIRDMFVIAQPSAGSEELYAQFGSIPTWRRWGSGESRKYSAFKEYYYTIVNKNWEATIQYHKDVKADDRTGTFAGKISALAKRWVFLDVYIAAQLLESQTNTDLLDAIPNSYYGLTLFSASHSFVTGGNIYTGGGTTLESLVENDLYGVQELFRSMVDEEGKPYWESGDVDFKNFVIIAPNSQTKVWDLLMKANIIPGGFAATSTKTNILADRGIQVHIESRLTDTNDWFVFLNAVPDIKPLVIQPRQEPTFYEKNMSNSDHSFDSGLELIGGDARKGYSVYEPRCIVKVSNS